MPVGNVTLAGLKTFYETTFSGPGLAPGETITTTLLGHQVDLRPTNVRYTYHFGDGTTTGPTPNPGGPYPHGTITHTYPTTGTVHVRIDLTLTGQYRINGPHTPWHTIPGTTTITGTPQTLTIAALQSRLHTNP